MASPSRIRPSSPCFSSDIDIPASPLSGPIVSVSPTLCSVSDPNQLKLVYGGKLPKSKIHYEGKVLAGTDHMLTLREASEVKARRGLLLPLFQRANLEEFFAEMTRYTAQMLDQMVTEQKDKGSVDVFRWFRLMAFDVIGKGVWLPTLAWYSQLIPGVGAVAYGTDMKMTASGKANQLVELMSQVFLSCEISSSDRLSQMPRLISQFD